MMSTYFSFMYHDWPTPTAPITANVSLGTDPKDGDFTVSVGHISLFFKRERLAELYRAIGETLNPPPIFFDAQGAEPAPRTDMKLSDTDFDLGVRSASLKTQDRLATSPGTQDKLEEGR